ncbi:MAG: hypothetical protein U5L11_12445 [Arhodomonas sp.]|nr:hypothetical protein [Arhodomonas sp.]
MYVSHACPWAHRAILYHRLKGLEDVISLSVLHPRMGGEHGWAFRRHADEHARPRQRLPHPLRGLPARQAGCDHAGDRPHALGQTHRADRQPRVR